MNNLTQQQRYKINSIDMSKIDDIKLEEATGYYDSSIDPYRTEFRGNDVHIDGNIILICSIIELFLFLYLNIVLIISVLVYMNIIEVKINQTYYLESKMYVKILFLLFYHLNIQLYLLLDILL